MLASTPAGDVYTLRDLEGMYRDAGFSGMAKHPIPTGPHAVTIGHKA
jgi:hypothetical protein